MISTFNLTKLSALLKDFYTLTHIRITVFNEKFQELAAYPQQIAPICQIIRSDPNAILRCNECDRLGCKTAAGRHTAYTYQCHAGLTESIMPLYLGNIVIGYLFFGHVFSYKTYDEGWKQIKNLCSNYYLNFEDLKQACWECPIISEDYIVSASHILQAVASYLCLERMVMFRQKELPVQIDEYILSHYTENLDTQTLCEHFQIGKTTLYEISKQNYGVGIAEHIRFLRIEKAKALLTNQLEMSINEIASACGFNNYNYFITVFKHVVGIPPKQYQKEHNYLGAQGTVQK